jgi:hypothetical protein
MSQVARIDDLRPPWLVRLRAVGGSTRRREAAFQLVLLPALLAVVIVGQAQYHIFTSSDDGLAGNLLWALFVVPVFVIPFVPVAIALHADWIGLGGAVVAFAAAVVSLVAIPWAVERAIANDPSSTAGLIHFYDPFLMTLDVAIVTGIVVAVRRIRHS